MEKIYSHSFANIYYIEAQDCVYLQWEQFLMSSQFKKACNEALEVVKEKKAKNMITNNKALRIFKKKDEDWLLAEWMPKALSLTYRVNAIIENEEKYNKIDTKSLTIEINKANNDYLNVKHFLDFDSALAWIKEMNA